MHLLLGTWHLAAHHPPSQAKLVPSSGLSLHTSYGVGKTSRGLCENFHPEAALGQLRPGVALTTQETLPGSEQGWEVCVLDE